MEAMRSILSLVPCEPMKLLLRRPSFDNLSLTFDGKQETASPAQISAPEMHTKGLVHPLSENLSHCLVSKRCYARLDFCMCGAS